ncbi:MAG TPA: fimbrillin family protein [Dysgonomonas sp.]|uniref:fimbrillin family protein n=1 Tax=unclassified Dysgonomonas TaxID=2630389 RepID=UPI0025C1C564|nr:MULTISPECIES: fimbrillin family protein [unclassified Dysgonomonas]HML65220.1 fimbrillin family protein [Dysgonomonas sp.]
MKKSFISMAVIAASVSSFYSCNNDDDTTANPVQGRTAELRVETEIFASQPSLRSTKTTLSSFTEGSVLSLFVTSGTLGNNYPQGPYNNVKAELKSGKWKLNPIVKLGEDPATVFAFYPYTENLGNGAGEIFVQHTDQVDYMYGTHTTGQSEINKHNTSVRLSMKHALSLLEFKLHKEYYTGTGKLTKIEVRNAKMTDMYSRGTINLETGVVTGYYGRHEPAVIGNEEGLLIIPDVPDMDISKYQQLMVLPSTNRSLGNIVVDFHIDGGVYTWKVPEGYTWEAGYKYTYDIALNGATLDVTNIEIVDWIDGAREDVDLY